MLLFDQFEDPYIQVPNAALALFFFSSLLTVDQAIFSFSF
jgi:hypothetical protein